MNNLVSRNPILRFKLGKKIVKALKGTLFGRNVQIVYYTGRDGKDYEAFYNPQAKKWMYANRGLKNYLFMPEGYTTHDGYNFNGDFAIVSNLKNKQGVLKLYILNNNQSLSKTKINLNYKSPYVRGIGDILKDLNTDFVLNSSSTKSDLNNINNALNTLNNKFIINNTESYKKQHYSKNPEKNNNVSNSIWLKGYKHDEIKDVKAMLKELIKLGLLKDKFGADGKWGKNTENAYQKYLSIKNIPIYELPEFISPAELVGVYSTENNTALNLPLWLQIKLKQGGLISTQNPIQKFKNRNLINKN